MRVWLLVALLSAGCGGSAFACVDSSDCADAGKAGTCQPDGWCSFGDDACPSGQRYGAHAGDGLAGSCVEPGGSTGSNDGGSTSGRGTTLESTLESSATHDDTATSNASEASSSGGDTIDKPGMCGDGIVDRGEECDAGDANGHGDVCRDDCTVTVCGDGYVGGDEQCEPTEGMTGCTMDCQLPLPSCGDGFIDPGEGCDGFNFGNQTCMTFGFHGGMLDCQADCTVSTEQCDGCGDSCEFDPCDAGCPVNEHCETLAMHSVCTAGCSGDMDCPSSFDTATCFGGYCVLQCMTDSDCPLMGMQCTFSFCGYP